MTAYTLHDATLNELIAVSSHSRVYAATHPLHGDAVALKITPLTYTTAGTALQASLSHVGIVPILTTWQDMTYTYQLMPLYTATARQQPPTPAKAFAALRCYVEALKVIHALGWVHGDVTPENMLLMANDDYALTDFDLATRIGSIARQSASPLYAAPEQLLGQPVSAAADVYMLGMVLYEWLTGAHPYRCLSARAALIAQLEQPLPALPAAWSGYQALLGAMTHKSPQQRLSLAAPEFTPLI